jgi:hypothetical protein
LKKRLLYWAGRAAPLLLLATLLIGCGSATVAQSQSGTTGDQRPGESTGLDQDLLRQVDARLAAAKAGGQDVAGVQMLRDSAVQVAQQGRYDEANGNLKSAALELGVLRAAGGEVNRPADQPVRPRAAQPAPAGAQPALLNATFSSAAAISGWERVGPKIPIGTPLWEVQNGMLVQRGVDGVDAVEQQTGLVAGDQQWRDVTVRVDALARDTKEVGLIVRQQGESYYRFRALTVGSGTNSGNLILEKVVGGQVTKLADFAGPELSADAWHTLAVTTSGTTITCFVDGQAVGSADDAALQAGRVGVSTLAMSGAYFANLQVYGR